MIKKICIIDDDPILVFTLKYQIDMINSDIEITLFSNGKEAFDFFSDKYIHNDKGTGAAHLTVRKKFKMSKTQKCLEVC